MEEDIESIFVKCELNDTENILVGCIYRPPNTNFPNFISKLQDILLNCKKSKGTIIISGDFNLNLLQYKTDSNVNEFLNLMLINNLFPIIHRPTRVAQLNPSLIDNVFTNIDLFCIDSYVICSDISDHLPMLVTAKLLFSKVTQIYSYIDSANESVQYDYSHHRINGFHSRIMNFNWISIFNSDNNLNTDEIFEKFSNTYEHIFKECFTRVTKNKTVTKNQNTFKQEWMNSDILSKCKQKNVLFKNYLNNPNMSAKQTYVIFRNSLKL